jgi:hypothetical protein
MKSVADKSPMARHRGMETLNFARPATNIPIPLNTPLCSDMLQQHTQKPRIQAKYHTNLIYSLGYRVKRREA